MSMALSTVPPAMPNSCISIRLLGTARRGGSSPLSIRARSIEVAGGRSGCCTWLLHEVGTPALASSASCRERRCRPLARAIGRSLLVIIWHLIADPTVRYTDLGSHFYDTRIDPERRKRNHIRQ